MNQVRCLTICMLCLIAVSMLVSCPSSAATQTPDSRQYANRATPPDRAHRQAADALLGQIWRAEPGQAKFEAIERLSKHTLKPMPLLAMR